MFILGAAIVRDVLDIDICYLLTIDGCYFIGCSYNLLMQIVDIV